MPASVRMKARKQVVRMSKKKPNQKFFITSIKTPTKSNPNAGYVTVWKNQNAGKKSRGARVGAAAKRRGRTSGRKRMSRRKSSRSRRRGRSKRRSKRVQRGRGPGFLNKLINKLPFELHLPGHRFTGPGTKLEKRLDKNNKPLAHSKPLNRVDETSMHHDLCYRDNKSRQGRNMCDKQMLDRLKTIKKPSIRERLDRFFVRPVIGAKYKLNI